MPGPSGAVKEPFTLVSIQLFIVDNFQLTVCLLLFLRFFVIHKILAGDILMYQLWTL